MNFTTSPLRNNSTTNPRPSCLGRVTLLTVLLSCLIAPWSRAATLTWDADAGTSGPQDGNGNWDTNTARWWNGSADIAWTNANGDIAVFGVPGGTTGTVTLATAPPSLVVGNITFNTNYALINSSSVLVLTNSPTITTAAGTSNNITSILAGSGFTKSGSGLLALTPSFNNTNSGRVIVDQGTLQSGGSGTIIYVNGDLQVNPNGVFKYTAAAGPGGPVLQTGTIILNGGTTTNGVNAAVLFINKLVLDNNGQVLDGTAAGYFTATNIDARSGNVFASRYRGGAINLFKSTAGTVVITNRPNTAASDGHVVTMNAGTLIFDKSSQSAARLLVGGLLTLGGGTLVFSNGNASVSPSAENPSAAGTLLNSGASFLVGTNLGAGGGNATLGALTRNTGSTFDVRKSGPGSLTTTSANVNGILGGWGTFAGADWLAGTTFAAYAAYTTTANPASWVAANNVSLSGNPSANVTTTAINSLRLTASATVTLNDSAQTLTLSSGGLLVTGSGATTITGGTLKGASGSDLIVIQNASADLTINSALADNGAASSLTKSGSGKLVLAPTSNGLTGTNFINGGAVEVNDLTLLASGPLVMNAGTLRYTGNTVTSTRGVVVNGLGATFDVSSASAIMTQSGAIYGSGATLGDLGGLTKIGSGTLILTASNYFSGGTVVSNGTLLVNGTNAYNIATWNAGNVTVYGGTLGGTGTINGSVAMKSGGTLSPGASPGTLTLATNLTLEAGSTNLFEITNAPGTSDLLVVRGNLAVTNSTVAINVFGTTLSPGTNTLIQYSGTKSGSFNPTVVVTGGTIDGSPTIDESTPGQINLVIKREIVITSQPADTVASTNGPASFSVAVTGTAPISYQWYFYGDNTNNSPVPLTDATNSTFNIASAQSTNSGYYAVVVTNNYSSVASRAAILFVGNVAPIVTGPTSQTVIAGNNASFSASVFGNPNPNLQWQTNGVSVAGATTSSLTLNAVPYAFDAMQVSLVASNIAGVLTNSATLTVLVPPVINPQPTNLAVNVGDAASFISGASGVPAPALQWYRNGVAIPGQTTGTLTFASAQGSNNASYYLVATNTAGTATSSIVTLIVNSVALAPTAFSPSNGATGVCIDTPLYITFNDSVSTVNAGKVRVYNTASPATPVDTIDMSSNTVVINGSVGVYNVQSRNIAGTAYRTLPIMMISSNTAAIFPHAGVLTTNQTYYVTIDSGVFQDSGGAYFNGLTNTSAWQFTTKPTGPANPTNLVVAADGSGDFATVQGALDFVPAANTTPRTINLRNGFYQEVVFINGKNNLTFIGQNRDQTLIGYPNNDTLNSGTALRPSFRANGNDNAFVNLTLTNSTPKGGTQAEALRTDGKRIILLNVRLASFQDTMLNNNNGDLVYVRDSLIQGDTDFIWGGGTTFLTNCEIRTLSSGTQITQARTVNPTNGFSFVNCQITRASAAVTNCGFGRDLGFTDNNVAFITCIIGDHINGWANPDARDWEYALTNSSGMPTQYNGIQLTNNDPRLLLAQSATNWLYGWSPLLAPIITTNPASLSVAGGASATFTASALGVSAPTYQWLKNGTNLPGATSATLTINNAHAGDAGTYALVASNEVGSATSASATLTVGNTAPTLTPVSDSTINVGVTLNAANVATDPDVPPQALTFSLLAGPTNATLNPSTGLLTWRPLVSQGNTVNPISVAVTDNGSPNLSATNNFTVTVNPLNPPNVTSASISGGQFSLAVGGDTGPDYAVQASTNLVDWQTIFSTNSPATPFNFTDPNTSSNPVRFYRIVTGPPLP